MAVWFGFILRIFVLVVAFAAIQTATAQDASPVRMRGEIVSIDGQFLAIRTRDGKTARVELTSGAKIFIVVPAKLEAIVPGTFVSTIAIPRADSRLMALSVVVHPERMSGSGEGQYTWDLTPETTMTNATVRRAEDKVDGRILTLRYPGGEKIVVAPADTSVVTLEPGDVSGLRLGSHVFVPAAVHRPEGSFSATLIAVGKDGLVPPM